MLCNKLTFSPPLCIPSSIFHSKCFSTLFRLCSEFGETDPDMVKEAVRLFVHSCAGYSVATYVLVSLDASSGN